MNERRELGNAFAALIAYLRLPLAVLCLLLALGGCFLCAVVVYLVTKGS